MHRRRDDARSLLGGRQLDVCRRDGGHPGHDSVYDCGGLIEERDVRIQIEIGVQDIAAFANLLPNELDEKVTGEAQPLEERLRTFLESEWQIRADGQALAGQLEQLVPAKRVVRDEVTGEALAEQSGDAEVVIRLVLHYPLTSHPRSISIRPPLTDNAPVANIGFVCYHKRLPVNDFRYLIATAQNQRKLWRIVSANSGAGSKLAVCPRSPAGNRTTSRDREMLFFTNRIDQRDTPFLST